MAPLFPIIVMIIVVVAKAIAASQRNSGGPGPTGGNLPPQNDSEEERMRRFMEAVGHPPGAKPPPAVQRRQRPLASDRPLLPVNPPANLPTSNLPVPGRLKRVRTPEPARPPVVPPLTKAPQASPFIQPAQPPPVPAAEKPASTRPLASAPAQSITPAVAAWGATPAASLLIKLREPASIRQAIILREVLGPPKALQRIYGGWSDLAVETGPRRAGPHGSPARGYNAGA